MAQKVGRRHLANVITALVHEWSERVSPCVSQLAQGHEGLDVAPGMLVPGLVIAASNGGGLSRDVVGELTDQPLDLARGHAHSLPPLKAQGHDEQRSPGAHSDLSRPPTPGCCPRTGVAGATGTGTHSSPRRKNLLMLSSNRQSSRVR